MGLDEVQMSIQKGYKFLDILEIYEYVVVKYDPHAREAVYLRVILTRSLNLRPRLVSTLAGFEPPEDEERYVEPFYVRLDVLLDRDAIRPNAAKRGPANVCLISIWVILLKGRIEYRPSDLGSTRTV